MTDANLRDKPWSPRALLTVAILVAFAFIVGFVWQYVEARGARTEAAALQQQLTYQQLANQLASAVIQADREAYEGALDQTSRFFTGLQEQMEGAPPEAQAGFQDILSRRDAVISAVSRGAPASEELLASVLTRYQLAVGGPEWAVPIPSPTAADTGRIDDTLTIGGTP